MNRREFLNTLLVPPIVGAFSSLSRSSKTRASRKSISFTFDDPNVKATPLLSPTQRADQLLDTLNKDKLTATLFVCGKRIDNPEGRSIISKWAEHGHQIANHTYSHLNYNDLGQTFDSFSADVLKGQGIIEKYKGFAKLLRFPYLKEGDTKAKRDAMRSFMGEQGYRNGYVTIDTSDWYIDDRLCKALTRDPSTNVSPYRDFYLKHILSRAKYYDDLAFSLLGHRPHHTILLHHTLTNALFLQDLIPELRRCDWRVCDSVTAFSDPLFTMQPDIVPTGESLIWALAKATGRYDSNLRYPGEDSVYEMAEMDRLGL